MSLVLIAAALGTWGVSVFAAGSVELGWRGQRSYTLRLGFDRPGWFARFDVHPFTTSLFTGHHPVFDAALDPPRTQLLEAPLADVSSVNWSFARQITASAHYGVIILAGALAWALMRNWGRRRSRA
ncbi:MAG: hypothetical protein GC159_05185 [Phycisphaera sp.]|nr:hypothetical protein [Phycisphaera sp.]